MRVSLNQLKSLLQGNVVEVKFARRIPKPGKPANRRMFCTNSYTLLNSSEGRITLNYTPPKKAPKYNPDTKNLIITWDVFMQGYRTISVESCELISLIPANELFWEYFRENLTTMSPPQKIGFMDV